MLKLANLFSQGMVLQREKPVKVWGEADARAEVTVLVQGVSAKGTADERGTWMVTLPPLHASTAETMTVKTDAETVTVENVAVGEVWVAGGQSNMEFPLRFEKHRDEELNTRNPNLRFFDVPKQFYPQQMQDFGYDQVGFWREADEDNLPYFSAVGYYFQKELAASLSVPVGIIGCNWGGTQSCAWMKKETVRRVGPGWIENWDKATAGMDMDQFWADQRVNPQNNQGNPGTDPFNAFIMPATPTVEELMGFFKAMMAAAGIPDESSGENVAESIAAYQTGVEAKNMPGVLFENMVLKTAPYTVRGVLWYQGESDDVEGLQALYGDMLEGLIGDWRAAWQEPELPFFEVQLPGFKQWSIMVTNLDYATIRRGQEKAAKCLKNVYMTSISDVGEEMDIHPKDKRTVGHRLADMARHYIFGEDILCEAPRPAATDREGNVITVTFEYAGGGLKLEGESVAALQVVQGSEEIPYTANVEGSKLVLSLKTDHQKPVELRFAQGAWYRVNLYNSANIPAIPFVVAV